jgi:alkyl hydroperoxide reductase subunit AhpC
MPITVGDAVPSIQVPTYFRGRHNARLMGPVDHRFEDDPMLADVLYPVLADTAHELSRAFGVLEPDGTCRRGTFVIDPEGIVRHATVIDGSVGRSAAETLRVVRALRTGELCPASWQPGQPYLLAA